MNLADARPDHGRSHVWSAGVLIASAPLLITLLVILWRTPYPVNEAVALFEDVAKAPPTNFLIPESSYYRPLFHLTLMGIWRHAGSLDAKLMWIRLLHMTPVAVLVVLFIGHLRPRTFLDAAAAAASVAVLVASPGFRDNLEIPLSYTAVGMPLALMVWMLLTGQPRKWGGSVIIVLTLVAIGFKEQGLVIVPLVIAAWWTRAPGASRGLAALVTALAVAYVAFRLGWRGRWPLFEQSMGLGFSVLEPNEAVARFGAFPYWMYAYNSASTVSNILFAEPTNGRFSITWNLASGGLQPWELVHLGSSLGMTSLIAWWGIRSLRRAAAGPGSIEPRAFLAMLATLLACGVLSFDYSRDRLGGMAAVFYAIAAYFALRAAAAYVVAAPRSRFIAGSLALALLAGAWQIRAVGTLEWTRRTSGGNQAGWLMQLPQRRMEFADRSTYLQIMQSMIEQGTNPAAPRPTRYPHLISITIGPQ